MASKFDNSSFSSINKEELKDISGIINELTFTNPSLTELHDIVEGLKYDEQIVFAGRLGLLGKPLASCTPEEVAGLVFSEKTWTPKEFSFRLTQCTADVNKQDKLIRQMQRMNPDFYNIFEGSQSTVGQYLIAKVLEVLPEDVLIKAWFSDSTADTIDNAGNFTNGTDLDFFNNFDGLFKQIFTDIPTTASNYVEITANAGADYDAQQLAGGDAIAILKKMYNKADSRLRSMADAKFYVTRSIYDGYLNDLESTQNQGAGNTMINENGQLTLTYRGKQVVNIEIWDRTIDQFQNDGTKWNLPNRALFTSPSNIPVGTLASADFDVTDAFYDRTLKTNFIDGAYSLDAKHLENYKSVVGY